jgi:hypothetical protein
MLVRRATSGSSAMGSHEGCPSSVAMGHEYARKHEATRGWHDIVRGVHMGMQFVTTLIIRGFNKLMSSC